MATWTVGLILGLSAPAADVEFNRDVRPILSNYCYRCHGPDEAARKAGLRLDRRADALAVLPSGEAAIVPGEAENSALLWRVAEEVETVRMPPPKAGQGLGAGQVEILRRWIEQGAPWDDHWSLIPPKRPPLPEVRDPSWCRNPIDRFILARLESEGLPPSREADRVTLARRLHFDLIGLPPAPEVVDAFRLVDCERLVDRLLASRHFGERMAIGWLDLVRFADTVGYHSDVERSITPYRDYVINAFNENMPFDRFTVEQLAGDLLSEPTTWHRVASAYNMLGMTTEEGGAQPKEYLAKYAADRVRNAASVWMGATLACAECHDHKFDPYSTRDFYAFAAFFADVQQAGVGTPKPTLAVPDPSQAAVLARLDEAIAGQEGDDAAIANARAEFEQTREVLVKTFRRTITTISGEPRTTRVLGRGDWMDESGEVVAPAVPHSLKQLDTPDGRRATRLDLARWLVSGEHPQTARVVVNRLWAGFFGRGLSATLDDLGSQGEWPTHPELLDWLAVEFVESGWDVKRVVRLIVTSSAYRQASGARNELFAAQAPLRLPAELIRDNALAVSGLLVRDIGGESARPYQPGGYWRFLNFPTRDYVPSTGRDQYRRGLYTHWQRTLPHPSLLALDAPSREFCTARRPTSNTPQAALALLNDPSYVEAARALAAKTLAAETADDSRLAWMWRRVLSRLPESRERAILATLLAKHRAEYAADPDAARRLLAVGQAPIDRALDKVELAAWTSIARAILNLDETITRD